ncbi:MAG: hypothetical protein M1352_01460 [Patescibacteria group bacterium]|nr:hypothetical protein [Patescibacteria group bacterium]
MTSFDPYIILSVRWGLVTLLSLYAVFSAVMISKVRYLSGVLETEVSPALSVLVLLNFVFSLFLIVLTLVTI